MEIKCTLVPILLVFFFTKQVYAQEEASCYGAGSIALSVVLTFILAVLLVGVGFIWLKKFRRKTEHLILETDPETGKTEFAFDNPGFKDTSTLALTKTAENNKSETGKSKWAQWSPLSVLTTKSEKRKTLDDTALEENEAKIIALRSHDFTGLGFNICGNMKEGIYIKDVLHRGPAFESGKLAPGDRINSVTINFEHMVYEDALTILSYASPYDVMIEARSGKSFHSNTPGQGGQPSHPVYRSSSCADLYHVGKAAKKRLFGEDYSGSLSSTYSSLQKSRSNMTTLERKDSKSPLAKQAHAKKHSKLLNPEQLKSNLEQRILADHQHNLRVKDRPQEVQAETQKQDNKFPKFGVRVMPLELQQKSPKITEQNENNMNIEKHLESIGIDEVDDLSKPAPPVKRREKKVADVPETLERNSLNGSGIRRNKDGIPLELPAHMMHAAAAALNNRKSSKEDGASTVGEEAKLMKEEDALEIREEDAKAIRRKGKAPNPPDETKPTTNFDEIHSIEDEEVLPISPDSQWEYIDVKREAAPREKGYNSDSDGETDNQSSVNTIELNSTDITIHQTEEEERQNRKTVSTGDLSKIRAKKSSNGLERAQSLDISDPKHKGGRNSDEDDPVLYREPRLSLILDGLNTFQRNRLKKSTEWGNLEDAIMRLDNEDHVFSDDESLVLDRSSASEDTPEFDALVNKINEIKRESGHSDIHDGEEGTSVVKRVKNQIWPGLGTQSPNGVGYVVRTNESETVQRESGSEQPAITVKNTVLESRSHAMPSEEPRKINNRIYEPFETKTESDNVKTITITESHSPQVPIAPKHFPAIPNARSLDEKRLSDTVKSPTVPDRVSSRQRVPDDIPLLPPEAESVPNQARNIAELDVIDAPSLRVEEEASSELREDSGAEEAPTPHIRPEEVLSKIPLLNSMVKNQKEAMKKSLVGNNNTDETKTVVTLNIQPPQPDLLDITQNFLYTEQLNCNQDDYAYSVKDTNIPDDIKVSRHSYGSLEREAVPKSDDAKSKDFLKHVSNVNVSSNGDAELHSLELTINEPSELYTTAMDSTASNPDMIRNATLTEVMTALKEDGDSLVADVSKEQAELAGGQFSSSTKIFPYSDTSDNSVESSSFTYITEIQVTPNTSADTNISEIEIVPEAPSKRNLDTDFENYVKSFESKLETFESNIQEFDKNLEEFINEEPTSIVVNEQVDEKELHKIQEIAEQQLKKLPEMKFTTTSYEQARIPEKRQSQIELLRSNFEKSPTKSGRGEAVVKSRIPIATSAKTPPMSPERRDSHNLEMENDRALLELMSSSVSSTPYATKYQSRPFSKNVTVTSIRSNSKIPSGLPTLGGGRASLSPRKLDVGDSNVVQVSSNGNLESSFKQWVFNPSNVTNVIVTDNKEK